VTLTLPQVRTKDPESIPFGALVERVSEESNFFQSFDDVNKTSQHFPHRWAEASGTALLVKLLERWRDIGEEAEELREYRTKKILACFSCCVTEVEVIEEVRNMMAFGVVSDRIITVELS
jgi:hypothetical protein